MDSPAPHHRRILWAISEAGPLSRTEISEMAGVSKAAVTGAVKELIAQGLLHETDSIRGAGRPATLIAFSSGSCLFAGLSLRPDRSRLVLCDAVGDIMGTADLPSMRTPESIPPLLDSAIKKLARDTGFDPDKVMGVGISVSGVVNAEQDTCVRSTLMGWENVPLGKMAADYLGLPVHIENDANALAMREKLFGAASEAASFALIDIDDGIGGAVFIGRNLFRGFAGGAGEVAHITVTPGGIPCQCGKRGCLDTISSLRAMKLAAGRANLKETDFDALEAAAAQGDPAAVEILHAAGDALGSIVAQIVQMLNPERVLIRLSAERCNGLFAAVMQQTVDANVLPQMRNRTRIDVAKTPFGAHAAGAASIATHRFLLAPPSQERTS
ncbi:MAG: ROK family transcriptional regulator [Rhodobacteraceae bacterium]|nr:ROK family transcriptional regulator [Paracoccaceae bacterium]